MTSRRIVTAVISLLAVFVAAGACQSESESSDPIPNPCAQAADEGCSEGLVRVPAPETCAIIPSTATCGSPNPEAGCYDASDCTDRAGGYCEASFGGAGEFCFCDYACNTDADCLGGACFCGDEGGRCEQADCRSNEDCEAGQLCIQWVVDDGCDVPQPRWSCTTNKDACRPNDDPCVPGETSCTPSASGATCEVIELCG